jgi:hypothetical protein
MSGKYTVVPELKINKNSELYSQKAAVCTVYKSQAAKKCRLKRQKANEINWLGNLDSNQD